ncbi:DUF3387 domain-containing protein [Rhodococcus pyridinivorans]|nr:MULTISPECIES: DUF3387 domain-containing protein [Rhodococcus]MCD2142946.1 DUF3387 domain-containing protein [Rhodococcus pyridinivorans]UTM36948.1 DUF3387 domain-containing protein [Rhodococcus pyridinivorans]WMM72421.1 DUF3387 domain-containing protein [Rhodococcus pyridinivorans]
MRSAPAGPPDRRTSATKLVIEQMEAIAPTMAA